MRVWMGVGGEGSADIVQECGAYVTGGNTSGFKAYKDSYYNFAMGIAEIAADGTFVITKQPNSNGFNGMVTDVTVRSQILYEIQGNVSIGDS